MDTKKSIEALQFFVTGLSNGAFTHKVQGQVIKSQGFNKLGDKYVSHYDEEMGWVSKFIDRILDLGGEVKVENRPAMDIVADPVAYIKCDLQRQTEGLEVLRKCMATITEDVVTYDIFKDYLKDEEEDLFWSRNEMDLIGKLGEQNWLLSKL